MMTYLDPEEYNPREPFGEIKRLLLELSDEKFRSLVANYRAARAIDAGLVLSELHNMVDEHVDAILEDVSDMRSSVAGDV